MNSCLHDVSSPVNSGSNKKPESERSQRLWQDDATVLFASNTVVLTKPSLKKRGLKEFALSQPRARRSFGWSPVCWAARDDEVYLEAH